MSPPGEVPAKASVWVLDDSPTEAQMALSVLTDYDVTVFNDGSDLIERVHADPFPPAVLVLDWVMPGLSGIEILQFLRGHARTASLPVLLLTAKGGTDQIVEGLSAGANDYLSKPYAPAELQARVSALLRASALRVRADRAEGLLRTVLAQIPDAVLTIGADGQLLYVNAQAEQVTGKPAEALIGQPLGAVARGLDLSALAGSSAARPLPDVAIGERLYAPRVSIPAGDDRGQATLTLRDVTDLRNLEARRLDFYSMVAHDMRSPLQALLMRLQLLLRGARGELPDGATADLGKMSARIRELISLINDFLTVSQLESEGFLFETEVVDLAAVAGAAIEEYQPLADAKHITLSCDSPRGLAVVRGDARRLEQVLANLISNSIKYTPSEGRTTVEVAVQGDEVLTAVSDDGVGIPATALAGLFQKWTRVPGATQRVEGSGLGLLIVREIVERHGGAVGVESTPGKGSRFWFKLPRAGTDRAVVP